MITKSGPICDVCGKHQIIDKDMNFFSMNCFDRDLNCHDDCKPLVQKACEANDWRLLPDGPIRKAFQEHEGGGDD